MEENNKRILIGAGVTVTVDELSKKTKAVLVEIAKAGKLTFDKSLTKAELLTLMISQLDVDVVNALEHGIPFPAKESNEQIELDTASSQNQAGDKKALELRTKEIIENAAAINEQIANLKTDAEKQAFKEALNGTLNVTEYLESLGVDLFSAKVPTDLPLSKIITKLPIRVVEQALNTIIMEQYPLMYLAQPEMVRNGIKQEIYKDFRDADNTSGSSDVTIGDFNMGIEPVFSEVYPVDTDIHKGYDILSSVLNDVTIRPALFIALINDFTYAVGRPIAKALYKRFITFLDTDANYDENKTFTGQDTKAKAKELYEFFASKGTTSRDNLIQKPDGSAVALEYTMQAKNITLILNKDYAGNYKYDLSSNTFNLGEIKLQVKKILVYDFAKLAKYSNVTGGTGKLSGKDLIVFEDGVYCEIMQYDAIKKMNTPKLKDVIHKYLRVGNYRKKNKYLGSFKS